MSHNPKNSALPDLRIRRTQKQLKEALVALTLEKGYRAITVQDITERAMVNRATFYRHFQDKYDLVTHLLRDLFDALPALDISQVVQSSNGQPPETVVQLAHQVSSNAAFFKTMLGKGGMPSFAGQLRANIERFTVIEFAVLEPAQNPSVPIQLLPGYLASAVVTVLTWCLEQEPTPTPDMMARWFTALVAPGIRTVLGSQGCVALTGCGAGVVQRWPEGQATSAATVDHD